MSLIKHAETELKAVGFDQPDSDYNGMIYDAVMELVKVFADQGHSGASASITRNLFNKLADYKPLKPIMNTEDEWNEVGNNQFQNKRLSSVFKEGKDGSPYYLDAIVWRTQKNHCYTGSAFDKSGNIVRSRQFINIPFTPKTFYVDVIEKEIKKDDWEFYIKDESQLNQVFEYYKKGE